MEVTPIFSTEYSIGKSIISCDSEYEIKPHKSPSIFAIAKTHNLKQMVIVDNSVSGYRKMYKEFHDNVPDTHFIFGVKITLCADINDKTPESRRTENDVIVFFRNSQAYEDAIPLISLSGCAGRYEGQKRVDWKSLHEKWTPNLEMAIPFYSSFLSRNLLNYNHSALPDFRDLKPTFYIENHSHPFDSMIESAVENYCEAHGFPVFHSHQVYYYKNADIKAAITARCIQNRSTWQKPEIGFFCSDEFSFEAALNRNGKTL